MRVHHNVVVPKPSAQPQPRKATDSGDEPGKFERVAAWSEQHRPRGAKLPYRRSHADNQDEPGFGVEDDIQSENESDRATTVVLPCHSMIAVQEFRVDTPGQSDDGCAELFQSSSAPKQSNEAGLWDLFSKVVQRQ